MTETAFDTLEMVQHLKTAGGFTPEQAESITRAIQTGVTNGVATKADLAELRSDLTAEISRVRTDLTAEISDVRADLKWMKAIGGVIVALLAVPLLRDLILALNGTAP